ASPVIGAFFYKYASNALHLSVFDSLIFPFYFLTLFSFLGFLISLLTKETIKERKSVSLRDMLKNIEEEIILAPKVRVSINAIYVMGLANGIAMGFVAPIAGIFIIQYITSDPEALGWLSTISGIMGFIVNYPAGRISDVFGRKKIIVSAQLGTRILTFIIPFSRTFNEIRIIYSMRSVMFNILSPVYRALQADLVPLKIRGKVFGTVQSLFNLGAALAPIGGLIYSRIQYFTINLFGYLLPGVAILFWISAIVGLIATTIFALYVVEPRNIDIR
ncbi:MAG: MFS transporter, partial [Candidatus Njordarchaeota archaeon]